MTVTVNEIFELLADNKLERLEQLLVNNSTLANLYAEDKCSTLLSTAVDNNNLPAVKLLIKHGDKDNLKITYPIDNDTVLISAVYSNNYDMVKLLVENGADINYKNESGYDALCYASSKSYFKIRDYLLEHGADKTNFIDTSLIDASIKGDLERVYQLINIVDVNLRNYDGKSALLEACLNGYFEIAKKLIDNGADINLKDYDYDAPFLETGAYKLFKTLLMRCVETNNIEAVSFLLSKGANVDEQTYIGESALMMAARNSNDRIVKILLDHKADIDLRSFGNENIDGDLDDGEKNALYYAITQGNIETVKLLRERNSSEELIDQKEFRNKTLLMFACEFGNIEVVQYLLETMDLDMYPMYQHVDKAGKTPLIYASIKGHRAIVEILIEYDVINHQDQAGKTALMYACYGHHFDIAKLLLSNGADKDIKDIRGYSVMGNEDEKIVDFFKYLKKHNPKNLVNILNLFTKDNPIKYTTHSFEWSKYGSYQNFINEVKQEFTNKSDELKFLSPNLHSKINNFLFEDKTWGKYRISFGWSSSQLKEWCEEEEKKSNAKKAIHFPLPKKYQYDIAGKILTKFDDICMVFKDEIEIRDDDKLKSIFEKIEEEVLGFDFEVEYINLENITFYTDVEYFENAVTKIFEQFKKYDSIRVLAKLKEFRWSKLSRQLTFEDFTYQWIKVCRKSIVIKANNQESYVDIIIEDRDSTVKKNSEEMKKEIDNGDFEDIKKFLFSLCDWSIEAEFLDGNFRVEYLSENQAVKVVELKEKPQGFRHILRFYK